MKYYKHLQTEEIFAFELDGSQDEFIKPEMQSISKEQADAIIASKKQLTPSKTPQEKLVAFLKANPDVASLIG
jgi:hypothetical protein